MRRDVRDGADTYILKEPDAGAYFRFDAAQYLMLTLFDGRRDAEALLAAFDAASATHVYDPGALATLIDTARSRGLLQRSRRESNIALIEKMRAERHGRRLQARGSLLLLRFHLLDPDLFLARVVDRLRWIWTPATVWGTLLLMFAAVLLGVVQAERLAADLQEIFQGRLQDGGHVFAFWLVTLTAIACHELAHGLTCKHYGGEVREMGFLLLLFQPCLYCNVNDAWMFEKDRQRIHVALAGV
ncbi:MAG: hypothetical protein HQL66_13920, partial [Magnetococcales bacterium]|nr:hypothetical protein [Magnetococcales bacterium]